jgi:hypothetical protein
VGEGLHADAAAVQRHEGVECLPLLSRGRLRRLRSLEREEKSDTFCTGSVFAQSPDEGGLLLGRCSYGFSHSPSPFFVMGFFR